MAANSNQDRLFHPATEITRRKARSISRMYGFGQSDFEDIMQDLMYEVMRRASRFDPAKGSEEQFVWTVVHNAIASLVEHKKAAKRGYGIVVVSLDGKVKLDNGDDAQCNIVDKESYLRATRGSHTPQANQNDLRIDLERAVQSMSPDMRQLAVDLLEMTPTEIARKTGIPRTTINDKIKKLRHRLRESGLEDYLNSSPSDRRRFR